MRNAIVTLTLLSLLLALTAASALAGDFRNAEWGMSKEQVKASESLEMVEEDSEGLVYRTTLLDKEVSLYYWFINGKLYLGVYAYEEKHRDKSPYVDFYASLVEILTEKYGAPTRDRSRFQSEYIRDNPHTWTDALEAERMSRRLEWDTAKAIVVAQLFKDSIATFCYVEYFSPAVYRLEEEQARKREELKKKQARDAL